jgi:hypothetical protein
MDDTEALKAEIRKLNARATQAKMDLHDLSEELPVNWERIVPVAQVAHAAHAALFNARERLARSAAELAASGLKAPR